jgi:hypothetical protein
VNTDEDYFVRVAVEARVHDEGDRSGIDQTNTFEALVSPRQSAFVAGTLSLPCDTCDDPLSVEFRIVDIAWYTLESDEIRAAYANGKDPSLADIEVVAIEQYLYRSPFDNVDATLSIHLPSDLAVSLDLTAAFRDENGTLIGGSPAVSVVFPLIPPGHSDRDIAMYSEFVPEGTDLSRTEFQMSGIEVVYQ